MKYIMLGLYPFIGTTIGASFVFILKRQINKKIERIILGLSSGVMLSASFFSLLLPSIDLSSNLGKLQFLPSCFGLALGIFLFVLIDKIIYKEFDNNVIYEFIYEENNYPQNLDNYIIKK